MGVEKDAFEYLFGRFHLTCRGLGLSYFQQRSLILSGDTGILESFRGPRKVKDFIRRITGNGADPGHIPADKALVEVVSCLFSIFKSPCIVDDRGRIAFLVVLCPSKTIECPGFLGIVRTSWSSWRHSPRPLCSHSPDPPQPGQGQPPSVCPARWYRTPQIRWHTNMP